MAIGQPTSPWQSRAAAELDAVSTVVNELVTTPDEASSCIAYQSPISNRLRYHHLYQLPWTELVLEDDVSACRFTLTVRRIAPSPGSRLIAEEKGLRPDIHRYLWLNE